MTRYRVNGYEYWTSHEFFGVKGRLNSADAKEMADANWWLKKTMVISDRATELWCRKID